MWRSLSINFYCFSAWLTLIIVQAIAELLIISHAEQHEKYRFRTLFINFLEELTKT